jgi:hypothetical protein
LYPRRQSFLIVNKSKSKLHNDRPSVGRCRFVHGHIYIIIIKSR